MLTLDWALSSRGLVRYKFPQICSLLNLLYELTIPLTFGGFHQWGAHGDFRLRSHLWLSWVYMWCVWSQPTTSRHVNHGYWGRQRSSRFVMYGTNSDVESNTCHELDTIYCMFAIHYSDLRRQGCSVRHEFRCRVTYMPRAQYYILYICYTL